MLLMTLGGLSIVAALIYLKVPVLDGFWTYFNSTYVKVMLSGVVMILLFQVSYILMACMSHIQYNTYNILQQLYLVKNCSKKLFTNVNLTNATSLPLLLVTPKILAEVNFANFPKSEKFPASKYT